MDEPYAGARDVAVWALRDRAGNVSARLDGLLGRSRLPANERDLARELALGTVRRRLTVRALLRAFLRHPNKKLPTPLEEILQVAVYQILFLDRVPVFAAVNEAVEQAVRFRHRRQSGLVNGVLRGLVRAISGPLEGRPPMAADIVPIAPRIYRQVSRRIFADPARHPAEYLAEAFSLPVALGRRWIDKCGSLDGAVELAMHANVRAPVILRVNRLKAKVGDVLEALEAEGVAARAHENGCSVVLDQSTRVAGLGVFHRGWVQVQDATASSVVLAAEPRPGMSVLDFCAAPGTKTTHLAELMDNRGSITAVDVSQEKIARIESNCERLGISIVSTCLADRIAGLKPGSFDLVLVDVPCSNTGVLSRRAEARWRFDPETLTRLVKDQQMLAATAAQFVRPGGRLVYSTCSIEDEECSAVARAVTRKLPNLSLIREQLILPGGAEDAARWRDGGYFAVFEVG